ncbi:MAG: metalloregulator ArsR/SmtB family transcription factor [Gammaproteobacteria bacterium]|nr:metalloregulator ArsR/SmtB family transcription factor [Gammaproteobacteria bacterium]
MTALRAVAENTRLRLLALIETGEVSVGELVSALEQSQPRISRHLKLLVDAGVVEKFRDSHHIYYRLAPQTSQRELVREILAGIRADSQIMADRERLQCVRQSLEKEAYSRIDTKQAWVENFRPGTGDELINEALDDALNDVDIGDLLNVRTGSGRLLKHLAPRTRTATGVDRSQAMRLLARSKLQQAGLADCTLRNVDGNTLPFEARSFDTIVLNEALGHSQDKRQALAESVRVMRRGGRLIILDWVQPVTLQNKGRVQQSEQGSEMIAENQLRALLAEQGLIVGHRSWLPGKSPNYALFVAVPANMQKI